MPDKMKFETEDLTAANISKLADLFPGVVSEGKVNFDLLRSMLGEEVFGDEAYEFTWVGKRAAIAEAGRPIRKTLRPCVEESKNWDETENLYIEGDNLDVLKLLQESYLGKVKMIYIDPPYNTGNDFVYRDNFTANREDYEEDAGAFDEDGDRLFRNTETNGRFHSDWCSMMYPRLVLARNMLRDDGVIFISIDDGEVAQLRKLCDEVFGEDNFVGDCIWKSRQIVDSRNKTGFSSDHEFILIYCSHIESFGLSGKTIDQSKYSNPDHDPRGSWMSNTILGLANAAQRPNLHYSITDPETGIEYPCNPDTGWRFSKETMAQKIAEGRILFPKKPNGRPREKKFLSELMNGTTGVSSILPERVGYTLNGTKEVRNLFDDKYFDFPKPVELVKFFIEQGSKAADNDIILDFFSGSATTAHAVMALNAEDGGKRKFIMVQLPEVCAEGTEAAKAGYNTICEIGKERIRRSGEQIKGELQRSGYTLRNIVMPNKDNPERVPLKARLVSPHEVIENEEMAQSLDIGFRVLKLADTNMNDVYYAPGDYTQEMLSRMEDNIRPDRTDMDLLFGCLLDWGLPLSMPHTHEEIDGFTVHTYNGGDLLACFDERVSETTVREMAKRKPLRAVFRDSSFTSSAEKINVFEIFKLLAPNTNVRVI